jgi:hypothetical protein
MLVQGMHVVQLLPTVMCSAGEPCTSLRLLGMHQQLRHFEKQRSLDVILQAKVRTLDLGGTEVEGCDAPNMLTGTIPPSWSSMTQLTQ